jgi:hypothetical protein
MKRTRTIPAYKRRRLERERDRRAMNHHSIAFMNYVLFGDVPHAPLAEALNPTPAPQVH